MKKWLNIVLIILFSVCVSWGQKLVIGSEIRPFEKVENLEWLGDRFIQTGGVIIDFYSSRNPSSVSIFKENIEKVIKEADKHNIDIVVVSTSDDTDFLRVVQQYQDQVYFVVDKDQRVHKKFSVLYLPYSVALSKDSELYWQGNLSSINLAAIRELSK